MKSTLILSVFALVAPGICGGMRVGDYGAKELLARAMDPQTMDPMRLSVLSVLKTAMPTEADAPMPTGDNSPKWYQDLPADVMVLLAQMYPATLPASEAVSATPGAVSATSALAAGSSLSSNESSSTSQAMSGSATSTASLQPTTTGQIMATSTDQIMSTGTRGGASSTASASSNGTMSSGTRTPTPNASNLPSASTRTIIRTDVLATVLGFGVGACFFMFA